MKKSKIMMIEEVVEDFFYYFNNRPQLYGSVEEIEANFLFVDRIDFILKHGTKIDHRELSWRSFLIYKKIIIGPRSILFDTIKNTEDPYDSLKKLRLEYNKWVEMKLSHKKNPDNSALIELLEKADERRADDLLPWFAKYPSPKVISIYSNRIKCDYLNNPSIAIGLAKMGDEKVLSWAISQLEKGHPSKERRLILKCISSSPHDYANSITKELIQKIQLDNIEQRDDIEHLARTLGKSANPKKFERLEQIIMMPRKFSPLKTILEESLQLLINENRDRAIELMEKLGVDLKKYA